MLLEICSATDNLADYDEEIGRDGVTIRAKSGVREHPLLPHRDNVRGFVYEVETGRLREIKD